MMVLELFLPMILTLMDNMWSNGQPIRILIEDDGIGAFLTYDPDVDG
jgi:hypothetical protein